MIYQVSDLTFASDLAFPQLPSVPGKTAECTLLLNPDPIPPAECFWNRHERWPDGRDWLSFGRRGDAYCIRFHGLADFTIDFPRNQVAGHPQPGVPGEVVASMFLDNIVPLYLSRRRLVLHASAVGVGSGCVAFLGPSCRGKSTLAAFLESLGRPLLTDDYLVLQERKEQLFAVPSYPKLNLRADSSAALGRARSGGGESFLHNRGCLVRLHQAEPAMLLRIFVLAPADGSDRVQLVSLAGREAFMELVRNAYSLDPAEEELLQTSFANIARVAPRAGMVRLSYPRDFTRLPEVARRILEAVGQG